MSDMRTMSVGSTFTGVGGFDLGFERAGMRVVWQCEADEWCRGILKQHWPDVPCYPDVRDLGFHDFHGCRIRSGSVVDLLCGGFPCQDLSVAGQRRGLDGERSGLFHEFARCADELVRPGGWVVVENVPGLFSSHGGRDFAIVVRTLGDLGFHDLAWRVLDSRYFGVPQRRRRVFIVARRAAGGRAREVLLEPESGGGDFAPGRQARARAAAGASDGAGEPGVIASALDRRRGGADDNDAQANHLVASTLQAQRKTGYRIDAEGAGGHFVAPALVKRYAKGTDSDATDALVVNGIVRGEPAGRSDGERRHEDDEQDGRQARSGLRSGAGGGHRATPDADGVRAPSGLPGRVVDPRPDGPRYSAMGNAVTVPVAEWIGRRIMFAEGFR